MQSHSSNSEFYFAVRTDDDLSFEISHVSDKNRAFRLAEVLIKNFGNALFPNWESGSDPSLLPRMTQNETLEVKFMDSSDAKDGILNLFCHLLKEETFSVVAEVINGEILAFIRASQIPEDEERASMLIDAFAHPKADLLSYVEFIQKMNPVVFLEPSKHAIKN